MDSRRFREAETAWISLATCKDVAFRIVLRAESTSEGWAAFPEYDQPDTTSETGRLTRKFTARAMTPGENPMEFTLRIDRVVQHVTMLGQIII